MCICVYTHLTLIWKINKQYQKQHTIKTKSANKIASSRWLAGRPACVGRPGPACAIRVGPEKNKKRDILN